MEAFVKLKSLWCVMSFLQLIAANDKYVGDDCTVGEISGSCKLIENCPSLVDEIKQAGSPMPRKIVEKLKELGCGFEGNKAIVCCTAQTNSLAQIPNEEKDLTNKFGKMRPMDMRQHQNFRLLPENCGAIESDRIIGGNKTKLYQMPWMVLLTHNSPDGIMTGCGGTLINEWYVLTVAHCVTRIVHDLKLIGVVLGEYDTSTDPDCELVEKKTFCASAVENRTLSSIIPHPGYDRKTRRDDIALLRLSAVANFSKYSQRPICLPSTPDHQATVLMATTGVTAGWGNIGLNKKSSVLLSVNLPIVSNEECKKTFKNKEVSDYQICAGGVNGEDSCEGDSGGPLMYLSSQGRQVQGGIVSYGSSVCGTAKIPGVFTKVTYYMEWILDNIY